MESKKEILDRIIKELVARRVGIQEACVCFSHDNKLDIETTLIGRMNSDNVNRMAGLSIMLARGYSRELNGVIQVERETKDGYDILIPLNSYRCLFIQATKSENDLPGDLRIAIKKTVEKLKVILNSEEVIDPTNDSETPRPSDSDPPKNPTDRWDKL